MRKIFYPYSFSTSFRQDQLHSVQKKKKGFETKKLGETWPCPQELKFAKFLIKSQRSPSSTEWQR